MGVAPQVVERMLERKGTRSKYEIGNLARRSRKRTAGWRSMWSRAEYMGDTLIGLPSPRCFPEEDWWGQVCIEAVIVPEMAYGNECSMTKENHRNKGKFHGDRLVLDGCRRNPSGSATPIMTLDL